MCCFVVAAIVPNSKSSQCPYKLSAIFFGAGSIEPQSDEKRTVVDVLLLLFDGV